MKTKSIPVTLMLVAGAIACVLGFVNRYDTTDFFVMVLMVLVVFYILGSIIKVIIDKNFSEVTDDERAEETEESEKMKENIESESEEKADE